MKKFLCGVILLVGAALWAEMPSKLIYQGRLSKSGVSGAGAHTFTATLVTDAGDVPLGSYPVILPATGDFSLAISLPPTAIDWVDGHPKLKISVDGEDLTPVEEFGVTPYALVAKQVEYISAEDVHLSSSTLLGSWQHPIYKDKIDGTKVEGPAVSLTPSQVTGTAIVASSGAVQVIQPTDTVPALAIKGKGGSTSHTLDIYDSGTSGVSGSTTSLQVYFDSNGNMVSNRGITWATGNVGSLTVTGAAAAGSLVVSSGTTAGSLQVSGNASLATGSGNVGVGTASPSAKLDVVGGGLRVSGDAFLATSSGNVGIGTGSPGQKLHVVGRIRDLTGFVSPVGGILMFGGNSAPEGWLLCDGSVVSRATYANLFSVVGTSFGAGDGVSTFNLPNFQRRVPVGAGGTGTSTLAASLGSSGGEESHTLTLNEMPSHSHNIKIRGDRNTTAGGFDQMAFFNDNTSTQLSEPSGGGLPHNIIQPSLVVNYIIKY